jgi:hypothetical protein
MSVTKLVIEGAVKQPEKACSMETKETTMNGSDMLAPEMGLFGDCFISESDQDGYPLSYIARDAALGVFLDPRLPQ